MQKKQMIEKTYNDVNIESLEYMLQIIKERCEKLENWNYDTISGQLVIQYQPKGGSYEK